MWAQRDFWMLTSTCRCMAAENRTWQVQIGFWVCGLNFRLQVWNSSFELLLSKVSLMLSVQFFLLLLFKVCRCFLLSSTSWKPVFHSPKAFVGMSFKNCLFFSVIVWTPEKGEKKQIPDLLFPFFADFSQSLQKGIWSFRFTCSMAKVNFIFLTKFVWGFCPNSYKLKTFYSLIDVFFALVPTVISFKWNVQY